MSSSSNNLTRSHLATSSDSRPSVHSFNGSGHLLTVADQPGPWVLGSGDGQMPRLPVHQQGVHSLDYPYQGSRAPTWASHIIMSDEGADFLRIPAPGTHAVPAFVSPNIFCCALSRFGHNMVAFAQQEGYEAFVLGVLPFDSPQWPLTAFIPKGTSDARRVVSDRDFAAALLYMAEVRERWEPLRHSLPYYGAL